jgi:hypothetical protein
MTQGCPNFEDNLSAIGLIMPSAGPPAAQGLTTMTGRFGHGSAATLVLVTTPTIRRENKTHTNGLGMLRKFLASILIVPSCFQHLNN